jgi:hypothetical protein
MNKVFSFLKRIKCFVITHDWYMTKDVEIYCFYCNHKHPDSEYIKGLLYETAKVVKEETVKRLQEEGLLKLSERCSDSKNKFH